MQSGMIMQAVPPSAAPPTTDPPTPAHIPILAMLMVGGFIWWAWSRHKRFYANQAAQAASITNRQPHAGTFVCKNCGTVGTPKGDGMPFLLFILIGWIPALLWGGWSRSATARCGTCKQRSMIPTTSPAGRKVLDDYRPTATIRRD